MKAILALVPRRLAKGQVGGDINGMCKASKITQGSRGPIVVLVRLTRAKSDRG